MALRFLARHAGSSVILPPPANFNRVARVYRWLEYLALGPLLARTRRQFLPEIASARYALVLGDGDGRFLARLLRRTPQLRALALDSSQSMLSLLQRRCVRDGTAHRLQIRHISGEIGTLRPAAGEPRPDLIVTHFFLDCFADTEVMALAQQLAGLAAPRCLWVLSEFGLPKQPVFHVLAKGYVRLLYFAFRLLTGLQVRSLPAIEPALRLAGFRRLARHQRLGGFLYAELWQVPGGER